MLGQKRLIHVCMQLVDKVLSLSDLFLHWHFIQVMNSTSSEKEIQGFLTGLLDFSIASLSKEPSLPDSTWMGTSFWKHRVPQPQPTNNSEHEMRCFPAVSFGANILFRWNHRLPRLGFTLTGASRGQQNTRWLFSLAASVLWNSNLSHWILD